MQPTPNHKPRALVRCGVVVSYWSVVSLAVRTMAMIAVRKVSGKESQDLATSSSSCHNLCECMCVLSVVTD